jgi:hypothetical protein
MYLEPVKQEIKRQIAKLEHALAVLEGTQPVKARRKLSAAGRKKIVAAQKARWKKVRAAMKK